MNTDYFKDPKASAFTSHEPFPRKLLQDVLKETKGINHKKLNCNKCNGAFRKQGIQNAREAVGPQGDGATKSQDSRGAGSGEKG